MKGYNIDNLKIKVSEAIEKGERNIQIENLEISDYIKQLDLLKEYIIGIRIPMLVNNLTGYGTDVFTDKPIDKKVIYSSDLLNFSEKEFFKFVDTKSDFRRLFLTGKDSKGRNLYSYGKLKLNYGK